MMQGCIKSWWTCGLMALHGDSLAIASSANKFIQEPMNTFEKFDTEFMPCQFFSLEK